MDSVAPSRPSGVQTLDRAVGILDTIARRGPVHARRPRAGDRPGPARPRTGSRSRSKRQALVVRDGDGRFRLGARLVGWGAAAGAALALVEPARAVLQRLSAETGESAQLYVREGDQRVCVATHERPTGLRDTVPLGAVMPLTKGSGGRVLLAWADDRDRFDVDPDVLAAVRDARMGGDRGGAGGRRGERERTGAGRRSGGRGAQRERSGRAARPRSRRPLRGAGARGGRRPGPRSRRARHHAVISMKQTGPTLLT